MSAVNERALVELIEAAMMTGSLCVMANKSKMTAAYTGATNQSAADLLRVALGTEPVDFIATRRDLVDALTEAGDPK